MKLFQQIAFVAALALVLASCGSSRPCPAVNPANIFFEDSQKTIQQKMETQIAVEADLPETDLCFTDVK